MKNLTHIASMIFNTPLLISPSKLEAILSVIGPRLNLDINPDAAIDFSVPKRYRTDSENIDGIGMVPIYGTLVHRNLGLDALSGLTSYEDVRSWFGEAVNSNQVKSILLDIDSFGGEIGGLFGLVDDIYQARSIKPIYAMVNESAYSAAYAIASAATAVFIPPTGGVGSIGVVMVHIDQSAKDQKEGLKYNIIYSGERKKDFTSHEPLPDEVFGSAQTMVDDMRTIFIESVARNRGISAQIIRDTEAGIYQGQAAVDIGLADDVMSYSQLIENITKSNQKGGKSMSWFDRKKAAAAQVQAAQVKAETQTSQEEDLSPEQVYAQGYEEGLKAGNAAGMQAGMQAAGPQEKQKGIEAERARCLACQERIEAVAHLMPPGVAGKILCECIKTGASADMAGQQIVAILSGQQAQNHITSTVGATSTGEINPLIANAKKRQAAAQKGAMN